MGALKLCPVCGEGRLHQQVGTNTVKVHEQEYDLPIHFAVCDVCECEVADAEDSAENKMLMLELRARVENQMSERAHERTSDK